MRYVWIAPVTSQIHWKQNEQEIRFRWEIIKKCFFYLFHKLSVPSVLSVCLFFTSYLYLPLSFLLANYLTAYTSMQEKEGLGRDHALYDTNEESWKKLKLSSTQVRHWLLHGQCCINFLSTGYCPFSPLFLLYLHCNNRLL